MYNFISLILQSPSPPPSLSEEIKYFGISFKTQCGEKERPVKFHEKARFFRLNTIVDTKVCIKYLHDFITLH